MNICDECRKRKRVWCPHNNKIKIAKKDIFGKTPPNFLVGEKNYPNVCFGPIISEEELNDDPRKMYGMSLEQLIKQRMVSIFGIRKGNVKQIKDRNYEEIKDAIMSVCCVDAEASFSKPPVVSFNFDKIIPPIGATATMEKFVLAQNPKIPKKIDQLSDEKISANEAISELAKEYDVYYISRLFSAGIFGKDKKMVPTKWAITATDDIVCKSYLDKIKEMEEIDRIELYENNYLDNYFFVVFLEGKWEYEQFEASLSTLDISEEYEGFFGRKEYAKSQGGGYYAARLAVCEFLYKNKRQAKVVVFREIGENYKIPVGVWEVRENVRHALQKNPKIFESKQELFKYLSKNLKIRLENYLKKSKILLQKTLFEF